MSNFEVGKIYADAYRLWLQRLPSDNAALTDNLMLSELRLSAILILDEQEIVLSKRTTTERRVVLFLNILPPKGEEALNIFIRCLLRRRLENDVKILIDIFSQYGIKIKIPPSYVDQEPETLLTLIENAIKDEYKENIKFWSNLFEHRPVCKTPVLVQQKRMRNQKNWFFNRFCESTPVNHETPVQYKDIFDGNITRIVIEGDMGVGKTFYLLQLAYEWATSKVTDNNFLRTHFDFVIYIEMKELSFCTIEQFIAQKLNKVFGVRRLLINMEVPNNKILLLLDGYDELDEVANKENYDQAKLVVLGKKYPFLHVIVTTRLNHIDETDVHVNTKWFLMKGIHQTDQPADTASDDDVVAPLFNAMCNYLNEINQNNGAIFHRDHFNTTKTFVEHLAKVAEARCPLGPNQTGIIGPNQTGIIGSNQTGIIGPNQTGIIEPNQTGINIRLNKLSDYAFSLLPQQRQKDIQSTFEIGLPKIMDNVAREFDFGLLRKRQRFYGNQGIYVNHLEFSHQVYAEYFASLYVSNMFEGKLNINKFFILMMPAVLSALVGFFPIMATPLMFPPLPFLLFCYSHSSSLRTYMICDRIFLFFYGMVLIVQYIFYTYNVNQLILVQFIFVVISTVVMIILNMKITAQLLVLVGRSAISIIYFIRPIIYLLWFAIVITQLVLLAVVAKRFQTKIG